jgi:N-acetylglucosamine kinase-like BadF-type ATPase
MVVAVAKQGDRIALQILRDAGCELGRLAVAVIKRLGMEADKFAIVPFGGATPNHSRVTMEQSPKW